MKYDFITNEYVYTRVNGSEYRCLDNFPTIVQNFWTNDPVDWDLEKKVTWDELAPSLQELIIRKLKFSDFDTIFQNRVVKIENDIISVNNNLNIEINTRQRGDQLLQEQIDDLKRRMTAAEARLTVLENRMDEAERQIELIWIEIRKLWRELGDIWGSDGKDTSHDITEIWKKLDALQSSVDTMNSEVSNLWDKLAQVEDEIDRIWDYIRNLNPGMSVSGLQGQVLKVDQKNNTVYAHDNFMNCKVVQTDAELMAEMQNIPISLVTVFNSWTRYTHFWTPAIQNIIDRTNFDDDVAQGQNITSDSAHNQYLDPSQGGWVLTNEGGYDIINAKHDLNPVAGFINPTNYYTNYYLKLLIDVGWDDDNVFIVLGYYKDINGVEHTLSLVRGAGYIEDNFMPNPPSPSVPSNWMSYNKHCDTIFWWGLIYDFGNPTQYIINDLSNESGPSKFPTMGRTGPNADHCYCYMTVTRADDHFEFSTSDWSETIIPPVDMPNCTFTFDLPTSKPSGWSQDMYDNITQMVKHENRVGFGVRSGEPRFMIYEQRDIFDDGDIYSLHQDLVYHYDPSDTSGGPYGNGWKVKGNMHDIVSNRIFMYHPRLKHLVFYKFWNTWVNIHAD